MQAFSWTVPEALALTFPQFTYLSSMIGKLRADYAIDVVFTPYVAAKCGKEPLKELLASRGSLYLEEPQKVQPEITPEGLRKAEEIMRKLISAGNRKLQNSLAFKD